MCAYDKYIPQFHVLQQFDITWKLEFHFYCKTRMNSLLRITLYFINIGKIKRKIISICYCFDIAAQRKNGLQRYYARHLERMRYATNLFERHERNYYIHVMQ